MSLHSRCAHFQEEVNNNMPLCQGIQLLKNEHEPLRAQMNALLDTAHEGLSEKVQNDYASVLSNLHSQVIQFSTELESHSQREENGLFTIMAKYIGRETGPIAVMEYEHELARSLLQKFMDEIPNDLSMIDAEQAKTLFSYVQDGVTTLIDHFGKEENVLFPMAENLLTPEDKQELERYVRASVSDEKITG